MELGNGFIRMMQQTNDLIEIGIYFPWKVNDKDQQWTPYGKNNNMAFNIALLAMNDVQVFQDALTGLMYGQEIFDRAMACSYMTKKRGGQLVINPPMLVPGADFASPSTYAYGLSQEVWMNATQKAYEALLTFYGKGIGDYHLAGTIIHTGEDSFIYMLQRGMYKLLKRSEGEYRDNYFLKTFSEKVGFNNTISSGTSKFRYLLWQRPAAYPGSTEQRYLWNVMLYYTEGTARFLNTGDISIDLSGIS